MSTVEKDGLKALAPDLTKRFVAAKVIDRLLSGKEEALTSAAIAQAIGVPIAHVEDALADTDGLLTFDIPEPWEQVSSFRIKGLTIHPCPTDAKDQVDALCQVAPLPPQGRLI